MLAKMVYLAKMAELAALYLNLLLSSSVIMRFIRIKRKRVVGMKMIFKPILNRDVGVKTCTFHPY